MGIQNAACLLSLTMSFQQDVAPPGDFKPVRVGRTLGNAAQGVKHPWRFIGAGLLALSYGWFEMYQTLKEDKMNKVEKGRNRAAVVPFLLAESDMRFVAWDIEDRKCEKLL